MKFVCGNIKMNGSLAKIDAYVNSLNEIDQSMLDNVCVCFPGPLLGYLKDAHFKIGAQDCHYAESGAFTGETSPRLLAECGCSYVIVGHSERRAYHNETDELIYKKALKASEFSLVPIVCIGETHDQISDRFEVLRKQMSVYNPKQYSDGEIPELIFAYEPVWAVGTGETPDKAEINSICEFISELAIKMMGKKINVLYGGSVTEKNAGEILSCNSVDGVLVGGTSLDSMRFKQIIMAAGNYGQVES